MNFPTESWGPHPCSDSEKKLNLSLCVYVQAKQNRKKKFSVVFIQVVKKSALHVRNLLFFIYLLSSFPLTFSLPLLSPLPPLLPSPVRLCSQDLSTCVNGKESEQVFGKNACHLFTRSIYICHSRFGPLVNFFVYLETGIWVERKKMAVV